MVSDRQVRLQAALLRQQAKLVEPGRDPLHEGLANEVPQGGPAPLREGRAQPLGGLGGPAPGQGVLPRRRQPLEPPEVERIGPDAHDVARAAGLDGIPAERLAQLRDVALDEVASGRGRVVVPQLVDHADRRDERVGPGQQRHEHSPLPRPPERDRRAIAQGLDRPQQSVLDRHGATLPAERPPAGPQRGSSLGSDGGRARAVRPATPGGRRR